MVKLIMEKDHMNKLYCSKNPLIRFVNDGRFNEIIKSLPKSKNSRILDAGCGEGHLLEQISRKKYKSLYGVDVTKVALKSAKKRVKANFSLQNLEKLDYKKDYFDVVICTEVIEHIPNYNKVLKELKRVLKKQGLLIITFPNESLCVLMRLAFLRKPRIKDHVNSFSAKGMEKCVGLKIKKKRNLPWNFPNFLSLIYIYVFEN